MKYWNVTSGKLVRDLYLFAPVRCMTVEGDRLLTGHSDGTVRVYESGPDGSDLPTVTLKGHGGSITSVRAVNGGANLISTARDASVRVWDVSKGVSLHTCRYARFAVMMEI